MGSVSAVSIFCAAIAVAVAACSSSSDDAGATKSDASAQDASIESGGDAGNGGPSTDYPAPHPAAPQVHSGGGATIASPRFMPIVFTGDPASSLITSFMSTLGTSSYWRSVVNEYGIGDATSMTPVTIDPSLLANDGGPLTDDDVRALVQSVAAANFPDAGIPDSNVIPTLFLPPGVTITGTAQTPGTSCVDYGAYHWSYVSGATPIAYVVIPRCEDFGPMHGDDTITGGASHELVEAVTDPFWQQANYGFVFVDDAHYVYNIEPQGELADMCAFESDAYYKPSDFNFEVARIWSNASASKGQAPCMPLPPGNIYNAAAPVLPDTLTMTFPTGGPPVTTQGIRVPLGQSVTMEIDLYSDAALDAPIQVGLYDLASTLTGNPSDAELTFALDRTSGVNGEKLHATITRAKNGKYNGSEFFVGAGRGDSEFHNWFGFAGN